MLGKAVVERGVRCVWGFSHLFYMPLGIIVYLLYSQSHVPCRLCLTLVLISRTSRFMLSTH